MRNLLTAFAALATLALVSCAAPSTPEFARKVALNDLFEVAAGKIASEKGQSEAVKQFGQHMVEAHTKTLEELKRVVESEKIDVKLPDKFNRKVQKRIDALNAAKSEEFDKVFVKQQIKAHRKAADLFDAYAEGGDNAALKQFAANTLPAIKQHLEQAEKLPQ
jgi:putative membrane protein